MDISALYSNIHTHTAIESLKRAYDQCTNPEAKKSIITAVRAIVQLSHDMGRDRWYDTVRDNEEGYDPSDYCSAV